MERAPDRDWTVVGLARSPEKLGDCRDHQQIVEGDVHDSDTVHRAGEVVHAVLGARVQMGIDPSSVGRSVTITVMG